MRKFWKKTEGFTLVELIVVIAILGILAGVGTVGYSGYIKKANMAADETLASDIATALTLRYYSDVNGFNGLSYVVLTDKDGVLTEDAFAQAAMEAAYGATWTDNLLKYNNWEAKFTASGAGTGAADLAASTFVTQVGTGKLLNDVQHVALGLSEFLTGLGDVTTAKDKLAGYMDDVNDDAFSKVFSDAKVGDDELTSEALANAAVFAVAQYSANNSGAADTYFGFGGTLGGTISTSSDTLMYDLASWYAANEALVNYLDPNGESQCHNLLEAVAKGTSKTAVLTAVGSMEAALAEYMTSKPEVMQKYYNYYGVSADADGNPNMDNINPDNQAAKDRNAYNKMLSTVHANKDDYITADNLNNAELMTSGSIASDVNSYVAGARMQGMVADGTITDSTILEVLGGTYGGSAGVVYFVGGNDGNMSVAVDLYDNG